ncbi:phage portal protein [Achromobacter spanius]|jgi:lambda family phage portal protein|uniref:Phage portal protein n=1 Tax=Achromobacter spanius TaxID=217203 RepID=A0AA42S7A4_9BURK|nr:phage portal protein [Achromobacter spanius]MDH0740140.1 phage portal protein [Achromobacter spanius]
MKYTRNRRSGLLLPQRLSAQMSSSYESGSATGSRARNWNPSSAGPNASVAQGLGLQRRRARDAVRNDPWATTAVTRWTSNVIGTGIQPYPQHPDKEVRRLLKELWADWCPEADADGRLDFYGMQALAARSIFTDGESLCRFRHRRPQDGLTVPLQLQLLEGDQLPVERTYSLPNGGEVVNGVEFDAIGRRVSYHLWRRHPGEFGRPATGQDLVPVPADQVVHAFPVLRPGQVRGVTSLASVLLRLKSIDSLDDAVMYRQEVSNLFAGFITRPDPDEDQNNPLTNRPEDYVEDDDGIPLVSMEPGTMQTLAPGEEVTFSAPPDAGSNYEGFMRHQLMAAFASVGIPYEIATGDLRGVSDRALRVVVNEFHRLVEQHQWHCIIHQFCRPVWAAWIDALALSGTIPMPDYHRRRRDWLRVLWVPQGWPYFNPVQDIQAKKDQVRAGFASRASVILGQGDDPDQVNAEIQADNATADAAGLVFDSDPRHTTAAGKAAGLDGGGSPDPLNQ